MLPAATRRQFLQSAVVATTAAAMGRRVLAQETSDPSAAALVAGKSNDMEVLHIDPTVLQTPMDALKARMTPKSMLFVRNNQDLDGGMTLEPFSGDDWKMELTGLLNEPGVVDLQTLRSLPQTSVEMVLQCSGNRRSLYSETAPTQGTQWGRGGIGNVVFSGAKLTDVLQHAGVEPSPEAVFLAGEGQDGPKPGEEDFEHSIPLADILETAILALDLDGAPLPLIHGGPVRFVVPGYYATMNIKWLTRLRFESMETQNHNQMPRYRTPIQPILPGTGYQYSLANSTPTWRMKIGTQVVSHQPDQWVRPVGQLRGWAWNDGRARIERVLVSRDLGASWESAQLAQSSSAYAWQEWSYPFDLGEGQHELWVRAIDALGRSQPNDGAIAWNPRGYEWNGVEKITLRVGKA